MSDLGRARKIAGVAAGVVGLRLAGRVVERSGDARNVRALAAHLGCSLAEARLVYRLARQYGYGAAHEKVFGKPVTADGLSEADADPTDAHRRAGDVLQPGPPAAAALEPEA